MYISALKLNAFRNYESLSFKPDKGLNIIFGENAQGKTNLLESLAFLAFGRSHRTPRDAELILNGSEHAGIEASVRSDEDDYELHNIRAVISAFEKKTIVLDGDKLGRLADLMGCLNVVLFSPESLMIVKGSAAERRRFLNMEISQLSPGYFFSLQRYNAALKQKNALLKSPGAVSSPDYARPWDEQLADYALSIVRLRETFLSKLLPIAQNIFERLSDGNDTLDMKYTHALSIDPSAKNQNARDDLLRALSDAFPEDVRRGHCRIGPHRDELLLYVNGLDARIYASQGQQRALALALKLSEIELIYETCHELPVVLLDDVFSELDMNRCRALLSYAGRCQCFITCANSASIDMFLENARVYVCEHGSLSKRETDG